MAETLFDHEMTNRAFKAGRLIALIEREGLSIDAVAHWTPEQWDDAADRAEVNHPSAATRFMTLSIMAGSAGLPRRATVAHAADPRRRAHAVARR